MHYGSVPHEVISFHPEGQAAGIRLAAQEVQIVLTDKELRVVDGIGKSAGARVVQLGTPKRIVIGPIPTSDNQYLTVGE
ncbi:MAG TPA: hypothetical protein VGJ66_00705 [Pyrinomonadaceae bacterium]